MPSRPSLNRRATPSPGSRFGPPGGASASAGRPKNKATTKTTGRSAGKSAGRPQWRPRTQKNKSKLSQLSSAVQSALPNTAKTRNTSKSKSALTILAAGAAAAIGGRELKKRKQQDDSPGPTFDSPSQQPPHSNPTPLAGQTTDAGAVSDVSDARLDP